MNSSELVSKTFRSNPQNTIEFDLQKHVSIYNIFSITTNMSELLLYSKARTSHSQTLTLLTF